MKEVIEKVREFNQKIEELENERSQYLNSDEVNKGLEEYAQSLVGKYIKLVKTYRKPEEHTLTTIMKVEEASIDKEDGEVGEITVVGPSAVVNTKSDSRKLGLMVCARYLNPLVQDVEEVTEKDYKDTVNEFIGSFVND